MNEKTIEFDKTGEDTCMKHWAFTLEVGADEAIIKSISIKPSGEGCVGHPKTIMALVRDVPAKSIDTERLAKTKCVRKTSCGMNLAACVKTILQKEG